jgi:hypothetical protein
MTPLRDGDDAPQSVTCTGVVGQFVRLCRRTFWDTLGHRRAVRLLVDGEPRGVLEDAVGSEERGVDVDG